MQEAGGLVTFGEGGGAFPLSLGGFVRAKATNRAGDRAKLCLRSRIADVLFDLLNLFVCQHPS